MVVVGGGVWNGRLAAAGIHHPGMAGSPGSRDTNVCNLPHLPIL